MHLSTLIIIHYSLFFSYKLKKCSYVKLFPSKTRNEYLKPFHFYTIKNFHVKRVVIFFSLLLVKFTNKHLFCKSEKCFVLVFVSYVQLSRYKCSDIQQWCFDVDSNFSKQHKLLPITVPHSMQYAVGSHIPIIS